MSEEVWLPVCDYLAASPSYASCAGIFLDSIILWDHIPLISPNKGYKEGPVLQ